ncbi:hypothetical protein EIP86_006387 [Pleurotus ostreatoroseus]|nr:hypothetical protein EIP86_006387 [Pleurotus ostreatoroseus]
MALSSFGGLVEDLTAWSLFTVRPMRDLTLDSWETVLDQSAMRFPVLNSPIHKKQNQDPRPVADLAELVLADRINEALSTPIVYCPAHHAAARTIQIYVRRVVRRNQLNTAPRTPLAFLLGKHVDRVRAQVAEIDWALYGGWQKRILCLGALPHILACVDALHGELELAKGKACRKLENAKEEDLEAAGDEVRKIDTLVREARRMQDALDVGLLVRGSEGLISALRVQITRIVELLKNVPENARRGIAEELDIARVAVARASKRV